ncbi:MAG: Ig-like domain-containing protein [Candidatus Sumerlaeia bacterium]|nr:Ig-like domain-containing protein [Candidatus Sumerlaeia bacterium]
MLQLPRVGTIGLFALAAAPIFALTGSGDSAPGNLDTVPPALQSLGRPAVDQIEVTFSEPMGGTGVATAGNYAVAGAGSGTLASNPDSVTGGPTTYTLNWISGQQVFGQLLEVTVSGTIQDAVGNPLAINGSDNFQSTTAVPVELDQFHVE